MFAGKDFTPAQIQEVQKILAFKAGIKKNDMIISINKNKVNSILDVSTFINATSKDTNRERSRIDKEIEWFSELKF